MFIRKRLLLLGLGLDLDAVLEQVADHPDVAGRIAGDTFAVGRRGLQGAALDHHLGDVPRLHLVEELRIVQRRLGAAAGGY